MPGEALQVQVWGTPGELLEPLGSPLGHAGEPRRDATVDFAVWGAPGEPLEALGSLCSS